MRGGGGNAERLDIRERLDVVMQLACETLAVNGASGGKSSSMSSVAGTYDNWLSLCLELEGGYGINVLRKRIRKRTHQRPNNTFIYITRTSFFFSGSLKRK